jgi:pyruvate dehydrogenase E2 component (dihydrolipoamide acetyltransferase)
MKEISLLKLKPTKQLWNLNPSMKELFYIGIPEGETAPVDSLLAIIGDEGRCNCFNSSEIRTKTESESAKSENKEATTPEHKEEKTTSTAPAALESLLSPCHD